jgi:group II intron reverse transcriptase/maturase
MSNAINTLLAMRKLGQKGLPLTRVYRNLYEVDLFLGAYNKLYRNDGAMTPGTTAETVDGMTRQRIEQIIQRLREERYQFEPTRRVYVPKADGRQRPISIPSFSDKLVQEVVRAVLEAYYEPQFSDRSHGFRPNRGCHTALAEIYYSFGGTKWFIEGDIKGCYDHIDHDQLLAILAEKIQDGRMLELIRRMLKAGYLEDWRYHHTYSGAPQGGVVSPLLSNIYLDKLDTFVETVLYPKYNFGEIRRSNPDYIRITSQMRTAKTAQDWTTYKALKQSRLRLPTRDPDDPNFSRLKYVRYADDFILGYIGPKQIAEEIREEISQFLGQELKLALSKDKTLITHHQERARFLGYDISIYHAGNRTTGTNDPKQRAVEGKVRLEVPWAVRSKWLSRYTRNGKPQREGKLCHSSVPEIIDTYQGRFRGLVNYYRFATNRSKLGQVRYVMTQSLVQTIAGKQKLSYRQVWEQYATYRIVEGYRYRVLQTTVEKKDGTVREIYWGALSLKREKPDRTQPVQDQINFYYYALGRSDLVQRMLADTCELCGQQGNCEVHHIKRLSNLRQRWRGKRVKPPWVELMIARQRKTLVVCKTCHQQITSMSLKDQATQ